MQVNFLSMIERKKSVRQTAFKSQGKILVHPGYKGLPFDGYPRPMLENQLWPIRKFFLPQLAVPSRGEERERERSLFQNNIRRVILSAWQPNTSPPSASHKRGRVANSTATCLPKRRERKSIFVVALPLMTIGGKN